MQLPDCPICGHKLFIHDRDDISICSDRAKLRSSLERSTRSERTKEERKTEKICELGYHSFYTEHPWIISGEQTVWCYCGALRARIVSSQS